MVGKDIPYPHLWNRLLNEWARVMDDYAVQSKLRNSYVKDEGGDLAYWHQREETNKGFLAGAVWRLGGVVLREFMVTDAFSKQERPADMWFKLDELECHVEAKGLNPGLPVSGDIDRELQQAKKQLMIKEEEKAPIGVALCFVAPSTTSQSFDFKALAREYERPDSIIGVYRPDRSDCDPRYGERFYPGVALIGQLAWKSEGVLNSPV